MRRLEYERKANLRMRWRAMERLESLCLDLRGYTYPGAQYIRVDEVVDIAHSLSGMNLEVLVIAGLRSWGESPGPGVLSIEEVERGTWEAGSRAWVDEGRG